MRKYLIYNYLYFVFAVILLFFAVKILLKIFIIYYRIYITN